MRRWHENRERRVMLHRWRFEIAQHEYAWGTKPGYSNCALAPLPPQNPDATCHCYRGMGYFRKRHPLDCGRPRCVVCHGEKNYESKKRANVKRQAIRDELISHGFVL